MVDLRRDRRPTERVQAELDKTKEKQTRKEQAIVKANARESKKKKQAARAAAENQQRDEQENIAPHEPAPRAKPKPAALLKDPSFEFTGGSQRDREEPCYARRLAPRQAVVPPAPKPIMQKIPPTTVVPVPQPKPGAQRYPTDHRLTAERAETLMKIRNTYAAPAVHFRSPSPDNGFPRSDDEDNLSPSVDYEPAFGQDPDDFPDSPRYSPLVFPSSPAHGRTEGSTNVGDALLPSPITSKRVCSDSLGLEPQRIHKVMKKQGAEGRPKAADYDAEVQEVISSTIRFYRFYLSSKDPYPDPMVEITWAKMAWKEGCRLNEVEIAHTPELLRLITARGSHLRGAVKSKAKDLVSSLYKFQTTTNPARVANQRARVVALKSDFLFTYRKPGLDGKPKSGLMRSRAIQDVIDRVWFKSAKGKDKGDAILLKNLYKPFPLVAIALVMTGIECALDEWSSGTQSVIKFFASEYKHCFQANLAMLKELDQATSDHKMVPKLQELTYKTGRLYAKEDPDEDADRPALSTEAISAALKEFKDRTDWDEGEDDEDELSDN